MKNDTQLLKEALKLIEALDEWIEAVPTSIPLPAMPVVDGDWARQVVAKLKERLK